jgi:WD40 repeat protein
VGRLDDEHPHLLLGVEGKVQKVRVSPDGRWIAASGSDDSVRLWPVPDLDRPPLHTLPHDELLGKLKALTNVRVVPDGQANTGYKVEPDFSAYRGWETVPQW